MKVSFENPDKINGLMTLVVEEADYKNEVEKTLKGQQYPDARRASPIREAGAS